MSKLKFVMIYTTNSGVLFGLDKEGRVWEHVEETKDKTGYWIGLTNLTEEHIKVKRGERKKHG